MVLFTFLFYSFFFLDHTIDSAINVLPDGFHVSRRCDWIMYAVEAEYIESVVSKYGPGKIIKNRNSFLFVVIAFHKYTKQKR